MEDYEDRYGNHFIKLIDSRVTGKEFEFDQMLLMPTAESYRALVEQARIEIKPRIMISERHCSKRLPSANFDVLAERNPAVAA